MPADRGRVRAARRRHDRPTRPSRPGCARKITDRTAAAFISSRAAISSSMRARLRAFRLESWLSVMMPAVCRSHTACQNE